MPSFPHFSGGKKPSALFNVTINKTVPPQYNYGDNNYAFPNCHLTATTEMRGWDLLPHGHSTTPSIEKHQMSWVTGAG